MIWIYIYIHYTYIPFQKLIFNQGCIMETSAAFRAQTTKAPKLPPGTTYSRCICGHLRGRTTFKHVGHQVSWFRFRTMPTLLWSNLGVYTVIKPVTRKKLLGRLTSKISKGRSALFVCIGMQFQGKKTSKPPFPLLETNTSTRFFA